MGVWGVALFHSVSGWVSGPRGRQTLENFRSSERMAHCPATTVEVAIRVKSSDSGARDLRDANITVVPGDKGSALLVKSAQGPEGARLQKYHFPHVFEDICQEDIYEGCACALVSSAIRGCNAAILAYGHTGSGKTYTMLGPEKGAGMDNSSRQGVIPRAIQQVFSELRSRDPAKWSVRLTFVDVYNETIIDLLHPEQRDITISDTGCRSSFMSGGSMVFKNIELVKVTSEEQALECLKKGIDHLLMADSADNLHSSRSHTILTLWIENEIDGKPTQSKLNLVDLAGSERKWKRHPKTGALQREAAFINRSIGVLSMVVQELRRKMPYVPFGDCKLTHFLKDSIGGSCRTLLIGCIFPDEAHLFDTHSTCRFAHDMQQIEVHLQKNNVPGSDTSHATLFRVDPVAMKCMEKMTELRASQQMQRYLHARTGRKAIRSADKQHQRSIKGKDCEHCDAALSQQLKCLRTQVEKYEVWQQEWEEKHRSSRTQDLRLLQEKVQELETKLSQGSGMPAIAASPQSPDTSIEAELQELRARVADLNNICYRREQDLEELQHFCHHVLNQRWPVAPMPGIQGINGIQGIQGLQGMPGVMTMRGMVGMQAMQGPPGMQGVPYDQLERRAGTPDYAQEYGSAGPFVAPVHNMHWGPFGQAGEPASSSNGVGMPSDLYTEASGYLIDPEPSEMSQQQWGVQQQISSPVWHAPSVFPPIPQHQMPGEMEVPVGLGSSSGGLDANASSDGGSTVSARPRAKVRKRGTWKERVSRLLGIGTQSGSEDQDDDIGGVSLYGDSTEDLEHSQIGNGLVFAPTQPTTPDYALRRTANEYRSCVEPLSVFLNSADFSSQMMSNDEPIGYVVPPSQPPPGLPRLDLSKVHQGGSSG